MHWNLKEDKIRKWSKIDKIYKNNNSKYNNKYNREYNRSYNRSYSRDHNRKYNNKNMR